MALVLGRLRLAEHAARVAGDASVLLLGLPYSPADWTLGKSGRQAAQTSANRILRMEGLDLVLGIRESARGKRSSLLLRAKGRALADAFLRQLFGPAVWSLDWVRLLYHGLELVEVGHKRIWTLPATAAELRAGKRCRGCGHPLPGGGHGGVKYCTRRCQNHARYVRYKERRRALRGVRRGDVSDVRRGVAERSDAVLLHPVFGEAAGGAGRHRHFGGVLPDKARVGRADGAAEAAGGVR